MELKHYIQILIRWLWLLLICLFLGVEGGYIASRLQKPVYQATAKILISKDLSDQTSQFAALNNQQLIDVYVQLLSSTSVINEASRRLNYEINLTEFGSVQQVLSTNVIKIEMEDGDPQRVANIVNSLVDVLIDQNSQASGYASNEENIRKMISQVESQISTVETQFNLISKEIIQNQLNQINSQITFVQDEMAKITSDINSLATFNTLTAAQRNQLSEKQTQLTGYQSLLIQYQQIRTNLELFGKPALNSSDLGSDIRLTLLQSTLDHYQKTYLELLDNLQSVQLSDMRNLLTIDQIEMAVPPSKPVRPQLGINLILGTIIGVVFALGMIFIFEYLDQTLKTPEDVKKVLGAPLFGNITYVQSTFQDSQGFTGEWHFHSQPIEAFNLLRRNLELAIANNSIKTLLLINISEVGSLKTHIAADLAVCFAQTGKKVILLDSDLRNPSIHDCFGLDHENGFSDLYADETKTKNAGKKVEGIQGLSIITGGNDSPQSDGSLKPDKLSSILKLLNQQSELVIIEAPSINELDSLALASVVDGVLILFQPTVTTKDFAIRSLEQLEMAGSKLLGIVLYRIPYNFATYFKSFRYRYFKFPRKKIVGKDYYVKGNFL